MEFITVYAIIKTGGKQYKVAKGDLITVEKLSYEAGSDIELTDIMMVVNDDKTLQVGNPYLENTKVSAKVETHSRGEKIKIIKFQRRKHHRKQIGHRQDNTQLLITDIKVG